MECKKVEVIHPGMMGISVAAAIQNTGHFVYWVSEGRRLISGAGQRNMT